MRSLKGARLYFNDNFSSRDCMVRNLSSTGAKVVIESSTGVPDGFLLRFEDGSEKKCVVRWRKMTELGVEFVL